MKRRILITGASGYVGSALANYFSEKGFEVVTLGRRKLGNFENITYSLGSEVNPKAFQGVETLIHCAYDFRPVAYSDIERVNVQSSANLFSAARSAGVKNLVFISSMSAYEGCKSNYGRAKLAIEKEVLRMGGICIRPGLVWGERTAGLVGTLTKLTKLPLIPVVGYWQVVYTCNDQDLCRVAHYVVDSGKSATSYYAADPTPLRFSSLMKILGRINGRRFLLFPVPWQPLYMVLRLMEKLFGRSIGFRSDSLVGLLLPNPEPDFETFRSTGLKTTPFGSN